MYIETSNAQQSEKERVIMQREYVVTFSDSNKKLFGAKDMSDLMYYLLNDFNRENCGYTTNDIVAIEER